jgi:hypothetical protein
MKRTILYECGEFVQGHTFKDYIPTTIGPSTSTFGHCGCGLIFNLVDGNLPKSFSTRIQLKGIAMRFAEMNKIGAESVGLFLLDCRHDVLSCMANLYIFMSLNYFDKNQKKVSPNDSSCFGCPSGQR